MPSSNTQTDALMKLLEPAHLDAFAAGFITCLLISGIIIYALLQDKK